jgi:uncharacterized CHY-type Zn-finger protein
VANELIVRCWKCKGKLIYKQISKYEIEVFHTCDIYCGTSEEHMKLHRAQAFVESPMARELLAPMEEDNGGLHKG